MHITHGVFISRKCKIGHTSSPSTHLLSCQKRQSSLTSCLFGIQSRIRNESLTWGNRIDQNNKTDVRYETICRGQDIPVGFRTPFSFSDKVNQPHNSRRITIRWLKAWQLKEALITNQKFSLIDTQPSGVFEGHHIHGAKNIPGLQFLEAMKMSDSQWKEIFKFSRPSIDEPIVFCGEKVHVGICMASAEIAKVFHFRRIYVFNGSYNDVNIRRDSNSSTEQEK